MTFRFLFTSLAALLLGSTTAMAAIEWAPTYGEALEKAKSEKSELFIYFAPTTASGTSKQFEDSALTDGEVLKALETKVCFRIAADAKLSDTEAEAFSKNSFFQSTSLSKLGGWAIIEFEKNKAGSLRVVHAFELPTAAGVFAAGSPMNVRNALVSKNVDVPSNTTVVANNVAGNVAGGGGNEIARLNQARRNAGLHELQFDANLYQVALARASAMARFNSMSHNIENWDRSVPSWNQHGARYEGLGQTPEGACYATWRGNYGITAVGSACVGAYCCNIYR